MPRYSGPRDYWSWPPPSTTLRSLFRPRERPSRVLQTDSRVGYSLKLSLATTRSQHENGVSLSFAADGLRELRAVAEGKISLAWINPSVAATLAFKGKDRFRSPCP